MENLVEVIEIWRPVESGGESASIVSMRDGRTQNMKLLAFIVGGVPIKLEEDFILQRRDITKEEAKRIRPPTETAAPNNIL